MGVLVDDQIWCGCRAGAIWRPGREARYLFFILTFYQVMPPQPVHPELYASVKAAADAKFLAPTSIYKSAWIVAEYKRRGGTYRKDDDGSSKGLTRWFREAWVDLERPIKDARGRVVGHAPCGRAKATVEGTYPLCRPSKRVSKATPLTVAEIGRKKGKKKGAAVRPLEQVHADKQKVKHKGRVMFTAR